MFVRTRVALAAASCLACAAAWASPSGVVVNQVYGGNGAVYSRDYVELLNTSAAPVSVAGWSVQYASSTGTGTFGGNGVVALPDVTLVPGQYLLVALAVASTGAELPTPDVVASAPNLSSSAGKVVLARTAAGLACNGGSAPCSAADLALIEDLVGYGSANFFEGSGTAPAPSSSTAVVRLACADTDQNAADFKVDAPAPHNSAAPTATCQSDPGTPQVLAIPAIQGAGATSPYVGQTARTSGVVTRVNNNGFFMQDPQGDGDPLTSDGIFVFTGSAPTVTAGDLIEIDASVAEYNVGTATNADTAAHTVTQLTAITRLAVSGSGYTVTPTQIALPEAVDGDLERYEGMLVTLAGPLIAQQNYFQGRYGQVTLAVGGRLSTPTNRYRPGPDAQALADANARRRIILDDGSSLQNPNPIPYMNVDGTLRAGDTTGAITGVIDYGLATASSAGAGDYRIHPTSQLTFTRTNQRLPVPYVTKKSARFVSFNVLNYFTTFADGTTADGQSGQGCAQGGVVSASNCRGASNLLEFQRQQAKIVTALAQLNADAIALIEMQNNGSVAVSNLVDAINARLGEQVYAYVPDPLAGTGSDAIKTALIYRTATMKLQGGAQSDTDPINNRPTLAQTFVLKNGEPVTVVVNHFKSKSCADAQGADLDQGDGQGCYNATRLAQAQRLRTWTATLPQSRNLLVLGDLNAYAQEDPMADLVGAGWQDLVGRFVGEGYSYVFDGAAGRLDQALASADMADAVKATHEWHINADEPSVIDYQTEFKPQDLYSDTPYRSSDHDPVLVDVAMLNVIQGTGASEVINGTSWDDKIVGRGGNDVITGGLGDDVLIGGPGADIFVYTSSADGRDTIRDFTPGEDRIDVRALLASMGYSGSNPVGDGYIRFIDRNGGSLMQVDPDGPAVGGSRWISLAKLSGLAAADIDPARDLIVGEVAARQRH